MTREERFKMDMIDEFKQMCEIVQKSGRIIENKYRMLKKLEQEPRKGHWKHIQYEETLCCSECGCRLFDEQTYIPLHYCPNCGAKMQEVEE